MQLKYEMVLERCQCNGFSKSGNHRAYVTGCNAVHKLKVSPDGTYLYFDQKYWNWEHNHIKTYDVLQQEHRARVKSQRSMKTVKDQPPKKKLKTVQQGCDTEMFHKNRRSRDVATQTLASNINDDYEILFTRRGNQCAKKPAAQGCRCDKISREKRANLKKETTQVSGVLVKNPFSLKRQQRVKLLNDVFDVTNTKNRDGQSKPVGDNKKPDNDSKIDDSDADKLEPVKNDEKIDNNGELVVANSAYRKYHKKVYVPAKRITRSSTKNQVI
ncbi:uncharacterized protein LOC122857403 [Aphidius gifuensis]|uniref:uncharacterized protein LOC122857403 n=1 Tax=Aphidius gifuensis TaxID=684658 RepID=UPI001CDD90A7|nr:uncharacterized protein LOC122857403 [Aphidius gifuensis]